VFVLVREVSVVFRFRDWQENLIKHLKFRSVGFIMKVPVSA